MKIHARYVKNKKKETIVKLYTSDNKYVKSLGNAEKLTSEYIRFEIRKEQARWKK
jgi:hypothetical protein